jgi:hypothetical protein
VTHPLQRYVATSGGRWVEVGRRQALKLRVWLSRWQLDEELIAGAMPTGRPALALRSEQLLDPEHRSSLATRIGCMIDEFDASQRRLSAAVPFDCDQVATARGELLALADALLTAETPDPGAVAMAVRLLRDTESALYGSSIDGALQRQAHTIRQLLVGE